MAALAQVSDLRQQQRQHQELQLSVQAQQRLQLLALPLQKLSSELRQRAEQNPFLEYAPALLETSAGSFHEAAASDMEQADNPDYFNANREGFGEQRDWIDRQAEQLRHDRRLLLLTEPETLYRHLETQVLQQYAPGALREQLLYLCDALDDDGYLHQTPHALLAGWWELHHGQPPRAAEKDITEAIRLVQTLDPPGVGARTLAECLELQVRADPAYAPERDLRRRLCHRLNALLTDPPERLARTLHCSPEELKQALAYLRTLNPFPGRAFAGKPPPEPPEVTAVRLSDGTWHARCYEEQLPLFKVNEAVVQMAKSHIRTPEERGAVAELEAQARLWAEAYRERNETLRRVAQLIFDHQVDFLESGGDPATLKPLLQRDIAASIGYDESTISRTLKEKMAHLSGKGKTLPLKAFFTHALPSPGTNGESSVSEQHAKSSLKKLIDGEDARSPLSDQALMLALEQQGIALARRTIAKYREQLGIPSTRERRQRL